MTDEEAVMCLEKTGGNAERTGTEPPSPAVPPELAEAWRAEGRLLAEACRRGARALRVKGLLVEALEACLEHIPGSKVRSWPPGWRLRDDALTKTRAALAEARKAP